MVASSSAEADVPRSFDIHWGFGKPLQALVDDRPLLTSMALLKGRVPTSTADAEAVAEAATAWRRRRPSAPVDADGGAASSPAKPASGAASPGGSPNTAAAADKQTTWAPPTAAPRPPRPGSAPASRHRVQHLAPGAGGRQRALTPRESATIQAARGPQVAAREVRLRELHRQRRREAAQLEERWKKADKSVAAARQKTEVAAAERVAKWGTKRLGGRVKVESVANARIEALRENLRLKEERLEARQRERSEEERQRREEAAAVRAEANARFADGIAARDERLAEANARFAERLGAMSELKRRQLAKKADEFNTREAGVAAARRRVAAEQNAARLRLEERLVATSERVEAFQKSKRRGPSERKEAAFSVAMRPPTPTDATTSRLGLLSPRDGGGKGSRPNSARERPTPRLKPHAGASGLDQAMYKCTLCEKSFTQLAGVTYLKAVATQRAHFGDEELLTWCERRGLQKMYESAHLCIFCCQFFAAGWEDRPAGRRGGVSQ